MNTKILIVYGNMIFNEPSTGEKSAEVQTTISTECVAMDYVDACDHAERMAVRDGLDYIMPQYYDGQIEWCR